MAAHHLEGQDDGTGIGQHLVEVGNQSAEHLADVHEGLILLRVTATGLIARDDLSHPVVFVELCHCIPSLAEQVVVYDITK